MNNIDRVDKIHRALTTAYPDIEAETNVIDLLTDLRHYCDRERLCLGDLDRIAHGHYTAELERGAA